MASSPDKSPAALLSMLARNAATSVHAPGQWRANGPVANLPVYTETFKCGATDAMTRKAEDQVRIWR